jgi:hypothetical protein
MKMGNMVITSMVIMIITIMDYDWSQRENPCSDTYYSREPIGKNILASDLGNYR